MTELINELRRVRVACIRKLACDVLGFELVPIDGRPLPMFTAGSHIDVHVPNGSVRQYSLYSDPASGQYAIAVKNEPTGRGGSNSMHRCVEVNSELGIAGPRNHFPLNIGAAHSVLVAGGIGITPIRAMIHALQEGNRGWELHYCARSAMHAAFFDELHEQFPDKVHSYFSTLPLLDVRDLLNRLDLSAHLYCCGPAGLMQAVRDGAAPEQAERVHFEWFAAPQVEHADNQAFEIELARSKRVLLVSAEKSVLQVLRENGFDVPSSCEEGVCGTCETRVLQGRIDHRDQLLSEQEREANQTMMICVSRAKCTRLVLDL